MLTPKVEEETKDLAIFTAVIPFSFISREFALADLSHFSEF